MLTVTCSVIKYGVCMAEQDAVPGAHVEMVRTVGETMYDVLFDTIGRGKLDGADETGADETGPDEIRPGVTEPDVPVLNEKVPDEAWVCEAAFGVDPVTLAFSEI